MSVTGRVTTRHPKTPSQVTGETAKHVAMTGVTGVLDFPVEPLVTGDRSSPVPPLYAGAGEGNAETASHASPVTKTPWRRPPWLYDGPLTDRVRLISCNRCRRPVLEALADRVMPARVDLVRLTPDDELRCLVVGGMTLRLVPDDDGLAANVPHRLLFRWHWHIRAQPGRGLPLHDCDRTWGPVDRSLIRTPARTTFTEEPTW